MALSKEEQAQLDALTKKSKEPEGPSGNVNFSLDLSSDSAWERAVKLGLVPGDDPPPEEEGKQEEAPKGRGYFGS